MSSKSPFASELTPQMLAVPLSGSGRGSMNRRKSRKVSSLSLDELTPPSSTAKAVMVSPRARLPRRRRTQGNDAVATFHLEQDQHFPAPDELASLPEGLQETIRRYARGILQARVVPIMTFAARRRVKKKLLNNALDTELGAPLSQGVLASIEEFSRWENLYSLVYNLTPMLFRANEIILHAGEGPSSGVFFLGSGASVVTTNRSGESFVNSTPGLLGHLSPLTGQPQYVTVKCVEKSCVVWHASREDVLKLFAEQSADVRRHTQEIVDRHRTENMYEAYSVAPEDLMKLKQFSVLGMELLEELVTKMVARVVKPNTVIYKSHDVAGSLSILAHGSVVVRKDGEPEKVVHGQAVLGEMSWTQTVRRQYTVVTTTSCDVFTITKEAMKASLASRDTAAMYQKDTADRSNNAPGRKGAAHLRYIPFVHNIPLLRELCTPQIEVALAEACKPQVFAAGQSVVCKAEECDRLIIFISGRATIAQRGPRSALKLGESIGYTCLFPHHWDVRIVAQDAVECLVISYEQYRKITKKFGVYSELLRLTQGLMFPIANPEAHEDAIQLVNTYHNPRTYPVSQEEVVVQTVCRKPTRSMLNLLPPIMMQNPISPFLFSTSSLVRISATRMPRLSQQNSDRNDVKPVILGKQEKRISVYKPSAKTPPPRFGASGGAM